MLRKSLSLMGIARKNIKRNPKRSFFIIFIIMLLTLFILVGSVFSISLSNGAESMSNRLGADIMIVPEGYDPHLDSILLSGKPSTFFLPSSAWNELNEIKNNNDFGIDLMTAQTFLATLNASCCSYPVQIVGIDYDTDFLIKSWLKNAIYDDLNDREIIVGHHVAGFPGETLKFFGRDLKVIGRLEQTGMGFDNMVFMNRNTVQVLSKEAERITERKWFNDGSLNSVIMLKLKPNYDSKTCALELNKKLNSKGIYALFSKKFINNIGHSLKIVSRLISFSVIFLWILSVVIIGLIFALTFSERKKEFGILRAIGADRNKIIKLCLYESFMISFYGALLGIFLGIFIIAAGSPIMAEILKMPFLLPKISVLVMLVIIAFFVSILTGIIASLNFAFRASKSEIYEIMRGA